MYNWDQLIIWRIHAKCIAGYMESNEMQWGAVVALLIILRFLRDWKRVIQ